MKIKYLMMVAICALFASCMGDSYAETDENNPAPFGNNEIQETNVVSIAQLKDMYSSVISTDYRNGISYKQVTEALQIKGVVTSTDIQGNIYNEIALQDKTGAIIVSVAQGGLYSFLPIGTEIILDLKDLYVGNYGLQAQIGVPSMNAKGQTSIGRISRATWDQHFKILSTGNVVEPEEFANGNAATTWDINKDGGKLGIIRNVSFKSNNSTVDSTYANANGGAGSVSWTLNEQDGKRVIVYNSNFADFANAKIPTGKVNITGIFKRFNNQWEIIIRTLDDVQPASAKSKSYYSNDLTTEPTDWTYEQGTLPEGISYVWKWASPAYGMKATAYVAGTSYETHARAITPQIDLTSATKATLTFDHAARFFSDFDNELKVQVSTDKKNWTTVGITEKPSGADWKFVSTMADLKAFCGKKIYIAFFYNSSSKAAATWEIKNLVVK